MIHRPYLVPPPGYPQESLLDQVLGLPGVPGHQIAGAQQSVRRLGREGLELALRCRLLAHSIPASRRPALVLTYINPASPPKTARNPQVFIFCGSGLLCRGHPPHQGRGERSPGQRQAAEAYYLTGLIQAETAAHLRIPASAVKTRLRKARAALRASLHTYRPEKAHSQP